jgi:hypothetical protein
MLHLYDTKAIELLLHVPPSHPYVLNSSLLFFIMRGIPAMTLRKYRVPWKLKYPWSEKRTCPELEEGTFIPRWYLIPQCSFTSLPGEP